ncbi:MAG: hypothetical protein ACPGU1_05195 [Myxococcota bacterium]
MRIINYLLTLALAVTATACVHATVVPLIGEDPEIAELLDEAPAATPASSPLAAARRLHQALVQNDVDLAWSLLSANTRDMLNAKGAVIGVGGRELIDASTLPDASGKVTRVKFDEVLFGGAIIELTATPSPSPNTGRAVVRMATVEGAFSERTFVLDGGDWKLDFVGL